MSLEHALKVHPLTIVVNFPTCVGCRKEQTPWSTAFITLLPERARKSEARSRYFLSSLLSFLFNIIFVMEAALNVRTRARGCQRRNRGSLGRSARPYAEARGQNEKKKKCGTIHQAPIQV